MKAIKRTHLLLAASLLATPLLAQTNVAPVVTAIDGYAARVNSTVITYGEIRESIAPLMPQLFKRYTGKDLAKQLQNALLNGRETLIEEALMKEEAAAQGLQLPPQHIDDEIERLIETRFDGDRNELDKALIQKRMTYVEWRDEIEKQIVLRVFYNREVMSKAKVDIETVRADYLAKKDQFVIPFSVKFSAILINKGKTPEERAVKRKQATDTLQQLADGASFSAMAMKLSEGIRADKGGEFPWSDPKNIRAELRPSLYKIATGQLSELIETDEEFYILKIRERREEGYTPFEELQPRLEAELKREKQIALHKQLLEKLAKRHYVERY